MVDGKAIVFTGLEPLDLIGMAVANVVFPNANDAIMLANGVTDGGEAALVVSGTSDLMPFESVALRNNTQVNIDTTTSEGLDTVTIISASNAHGNTNLNLTTGLGGGDMIDVSGPVVFAGTVSLASQQIDFNNPTSQIAAGGLVTLDAGSGAISNGSVGSVDVAAPTLHIAAAVTADVDTTIGTLTGAAASTVLIREADSLVVPGFTVASGAIVIVAGNDVDAQNLAVTVDDPLHSIQVFIVRQHHHRNDHRWHGNHQRRGALRRGVGARRWQQRHPHHGRQPVPEGGRRRPAGSDRPDRHHGPLARSALDQRHVRAARHLLKRVGCHRHQLGHHVPRRHRDHLRRHAHRDLRHRQRQPA